MKRSLMYVSAIVLFGAITLAAAGPNSQGQNQNGNGNQIQNRKRPRRVPEPSVIGMLGLSAGAVASGLAIRRRRKD